MRFAVTGASGLVGTALCSALERDGHDVLRLVRRTPRGAGEVRWDPGTGEVDGVALEGQDAVVHLAGESIASGRWTPARKARLEESRVRGTALVARTLAKRDAKPGCLLCASAVGIYGHRGGEWVDADSMPGSGFLASLCRRWEAAADPAREAGIRTVHMRLGVVLARHGGALAKMLLPFRLGLGGRVGNGRQYTSWIALDDAVDAIRHLATSTLEGPVDVVAPHPVTNAAFTKALGDALHRPTPFPIPKAAARLAFGELADELLLASTRVRPTALLRDGYAFTHPDLESALDHAFR